MLDTVYSIGALGVTSLARVQDFGDFAGATVSQLVQPLVNTLRNLLNSSSVVRKLNQVRYYFSDSSCLILYVPDAGGTVESTGTTTGRKVQFGYASYPIELKQVYNTEDETGTERTFFTADDGYVYEDLVGNNFDGAEIESYIRTSFLHAGTPAYKKRFRRLDMELSAIQALDLKVASDLTYGASEVSSGLASVTAGNVPVIDVFGGGGFWGAANWDAFVWDGQAISTARAQLTGSGENISFLVFHADAVTPPFVLQGFTLHYEIRRLQR